MKLLSIGMALLTVILSCSCDTKPTKQVEKETGLEITFVKKESDKKIDVLIDGKFFTAYSWPDNVYKPVLYPVMTSAGTEITRGFPLKPRPDERADHRHHVGIWLNYGNVNGSDFWGNGSEGKRAENGGEIKHLDVEKLSEGTGEGFIITNERWIDPAGKELLSERTEYHFIAEGTTRFIDRVTSLTATGEAVSLKDTKEGMFGIRVARQLELPSKDDVILTDAQGQPTTVKKMSNEGVSGNYRSSEGITGEAVWGTRAKWMDLYGSIGDEKISLVLIDHPENIGYPTYWHARGYGLFAANPFGVKDFTQGKEEMNYILPAGKSLTFKHRVVVHSGNHLTDAEINAYADDFSRKY